MSKWSFVAIAVVLAVLPAKAWSQKLIPFSPVKSVCPTCTTGPQYDRVVLKDGTEVKAVVVAENAKFYTLRKFGELRALGKDQVQTLEKNPKAERPGGFDDQILLQNGIVLAGTLKTKDDADPFQLETPTSKTTQTAFRSVIDSVYRGGTRVFPK